MHACALPLWIAVRSLFTIALDGITLTLEEKLCCCRPLPTPRLGELRLAIAVPGGAVPAQLASWESNAPGVFGLGVAVEGGRAAGLRWDRFGGFVGAGFLG